MVLLREVLQPELSLDHPILPLHMPPPFKVVPADSIKQLKMGKISASMYLQDCIFKRVFLNSSDKVKLLGPHNQNVPLYACFCQSNLKKKMIWQIVDFYA